MTSYRVPAIAFEQAYRLAEAVLAGECKSSAAENELIKLNPEMSPRAAGGYIGCYLAMRKGKRRFGTTIAAAAWHFMLERIALDGPGPLIVALETFMSHIVYVQSKTKGPETSLYKVHEEFVLRLKRQATFNIESIELDDAICKSLGDSTESRATRLAIAPTRPEQVVVLVRAFRRNPDVIAEVLFRARGICEHCGKQAPFQRSDGSPFLEVHHKRRLADGGEDSVQNAIALCPNCHRERHHGANFAIAR